MMVSDFGNFMMLIFKLQGNQASSADKIAISRLSPSRLAFKGDNYEAAVLTDSTALVFTALARFLIIYGGPSAFIFLTGPFLKRVFENENIKQFS